jgi:hypothetical protein
MNSILHLVHIGFDAWEHQEFENKIQTVIAKTLQTADPYFNFVDIPSYPTHSEAESLQILALWEQFSRYFSLSSWFPTYINKQWFSEIYSHLLLKYQDVQVLVDSMDVSDFLSNEGSCTDLDEIFSRLVEYFKWKNPYSIKSRDFQDFTTPKLRNAWRYERISEIVQYEAWADRITHSSMFDADIKRAEQMASLTWINQTHSRQQQVISAVRKIIEENTRNNVDSVLKLVQEKWLEKNLHIVSWEYAYRCVTQYRKCLEAVSSISWPVLTDFFAILPDPKCSSDVRIYNENLKDVAQKFPDKYSSLIQTKL